MLLQDDNNMFCDFQIFPATRKEAARLYFNSQELPTVNVRAMSKYIQLVFGLFLRTGFCPNTFRLQCVQQKYTEA